MAEVLTGAAEDRAPSEEETALLYAALRELIVELRREVR
jgi:hypothetical protein